MTVLAKSDPGREWFIRQVAEGDSALDAETIKRFSTQLGIPFDTGAYFCVAVQYADAQVIREDISKLDKLIQSCVAIAKTLKCDSYCYAGNQMRAVLIISGERADRARIVRKIQSGLAKRISETVQIGVGRSIAEIEKLSYSRVESYEALNYIRKDATVSYIEDIYITRSSTTRKLERERRKIVELFRQGDWDQMKTCIEVLVENVRKESPVREGRAYPTTIRRTMVDLQSEIMHICADAGIDVEAVINRQDPYNYIYELSDTYLIIAKFLDVARVLFDAMAEQNTCTESNLLSAARKCIDANIGDPDLSLSFVSEALGITPTYFSAFFIREMGIGFSEHITMLRLEQAKKLLTETNMKISDIAGTCGFRTASYFIVVFKKHTGISPGEFRNM